MKWLGVKDKEFFKYIRIIKKTTECFFIIFLILFPSKIFSEDCKFYLSEATRIEKYSKLLAIPLYEKCLSLIPGKKFRRIAVKRLFDLYYLNSKVEELILLGNEHKLDKKREKKLRKLYQKLSIGIGIDEIKFLEFLELLLVNNPSSRDKLLEFYVNEKSAYLLNYIFAIKYKTNDLESLGYIISEIPDINPTLKLAFLVKIDSSNVEKTIEDISKISGLSDDQRMEILYLYGIYLQRKRRYKLSARYFRMSASYENKREGFIKMGILEASKSLFITGKRKESCELLHGNEIYVQNESDEFMKFYCNIDTRNQLVEMKSSLELLAKKDSGLIFRSYLNFGGKQKGFEEAGDE